MNGFGLINMSRPKGEYEQELRVTLGRVYDPKVGRFLSPDPILQNSSNTQNMNRYSYVWNNPLKYVDPSGYYNQAAASIGGSSETGQVSIGSGNWYGTGGGGTMSWNLGTIYNADGSFKEIGLSFEDLYTDINGTWVRNRDIIKISGDSFRQALGRYSDLVASAYRYGSSLAATMDGIQISAAFDNGSVFTISAQNGLYSVSDLAVTIYGHSYILSTQKAVYDWAGSVDWREVGNAGLGIFLGGLEVAAGGAGEGVTFGASTALILDGWARIGSGEVKLYHLLQGNTKAGVATPSNLGGWSGKLVDMGFGSSYTDIGIGQGLGGFTNDFATFVAGGGSYYAVTNMLKAPMLGTTFQYFSVTAGTVYSTTSDVSTWYNLNH